MEYTELCQLAFKYGTDKCPQIKHAYTPFYYHLLKDKKQSVKKLLELGIGHTRRNGHTSESSKPYLQRGASLYMWRDFFPNAMIFGADLDPQTLFTDTRIQTFLSDERQPEELANLIRNIGADIDVVIDDASHHVHDQIFAAQTLIPLLKKDFTYVVEDCSHTKQICWALASQGNFNFYVPPVPRTWSGGMLLVIRKG